MDLSAALALVSAAAGGAATAAGESAWQALRGVLGRFVGREGAEELEPPEAPAPDADPESVAEFRARLAQLAAENPQFRTALVEWATEHQERLTGRSAGEVHNVVGDNATVHGSVVQLRDVGGDLHIG